MHKKRIRDTIYYYTSVRENGKVKTVYLGRSEKEALESERQLKTSRAGGPSNAARSFLNGRLLVYLAIVVFVTTGLLFLRGYYVGYVAVSGPEMYSPGEKLAGTVNLTFASGSLYPEDSVVEVSLDGQTVQADLSTLLSESGADVSHGTGEYYVPGSDVSGYGKGFGVPGGRTVYPEILFSYALSCNSDSGTVRQEFAGVCSAVNPYVMKIPESLTGCIIELLNASLRNETTESLVQAAIENGSVIVKTDYSETEKGLGKGFAGGGEITVPVDLGKFDMTIPDKAGELEIKVRVLHNQSVLEEAGKNISVSLPAANKTSQIPFASNVTQAQACRDEDKDGYDTCKQPIDCNDNDPSIHPGAKEICGNLADENCDGFAEPCTNLKDVMASKRPAFVSDEVVREIGSRKSARVIIRMKDNAKKSSVKSEIVPRKEFGNVMTAVVDENEMVRLASRFSEKDIELIQIDHPIKLALDDVVNQTGVNLAWDLNLTGKGQTVCIVDSGIDYSHPDLSGRYIGGYDFVNNDFNPMDDNGHGTYVAGIVADIAPGTKILAAKAFDIDGTGYESDILAGIDYCVMNRDTYNVSVILMSFGGWTFNTSCYCDSNLVANESNFAVSQGIFAVAASGNDGSAYLKAPACGTNVTSVGAVDRYDAVANFTNIEPLLDLLAPGVNVESAKMGGGYETRSGTSASAAVAAGIAALVRESEPLAPLDLQYRLRSTGILVAYNGTTYPRIDAYTALVNNVTNSPPATQDGNECDGFFTEYRPLAACASSCTYPLGSECVTPCCSGVFEYASGSCDPPGVCSYWYQSCSFNCGDECENYLDCPDKCVGNTHYYSGSCGAFTCACSWGSSEDCLAQCSGNQPGEGCSGGSCDYGTSCTLRCSGTQPGTGCTGGSCDWGTSCTSQCNVNQPGTGCSSGSCTWGTSCLSQCGGTGNLQPGSGCSSGSCTWGTSCTSQCSGARHYTGCSSGSCTSPICAVGYCGAACGGDGDCGGGTCNTTSCTCISGSVINITLIAPDDGYSTLNPSSITFNALVWTSPTLANVSLYGNWTGSWARNDTNTSGVNNSYYIFTNNLNSYADGAYKWNYQACRTDGNCSFSPANRTLIIDRTIPPTLNITETLSPDVAYTSTTVYVYGHMNLSNGTDAVNNPFYIWLNGAPLTMQNLTAGSGTYSNNKNFTQTASNDWSGGTFVNTTYDSENVTLGGTNTTGTFQSTIVNANAIAAWKNMSWIEPYKYGDDLPNNRGVESGTINMTGNVLLFHFNNDPAYGESSSFAYDFSGTGNSGTITGGTWTSSGRLGAGALNFNGSGSYVNCGTASSLNFESSINFTFVAWIKSSATAPQYPTIFAKRVATPIGYAMFLWDTGNLSAQLSNTGGGWTNYVALSGSLRDGKWHHVAMVGDRSKNLTFYVDGAKKGCDPAVASCDISGKGNITSSPALTVGWDAANPGNSYFNGTIDEPVVYNRTLSAAEIYDQYIRGLNLKFQARSCDDSACSGESYVGPNGSTTDYFTNGSKIYSLANFSSNQYFQYEAFFETLPSSGIKPYLQEVVMNYSVVVSDSSGNYNYSFTAPAAEGTYPVKVNATFLGYYNNNSKDLIVSTYIVNGGHGTTCDASNKCMLIQNSTGSVKARFDKNGNVDVKGIYLPSQSSPSPPAGSFIVRNTTSQTVLYVNNTGGLVLRGVFTRQSSISPSGNNDFILKDSTGTVVGLIDGATGNMYFKGVLHYNSDF